MNISKVPRWLRASIGLYLAAGLLAALGGCSNPQTPGFNGTINDANGIAVAAAGYYAGARIVPFAGLGNHAVTGVRVAPRGGAFNLADFARTQIEALAAQKGQYPSSTLAGVVTAIPYECRTGSGTIQWDDKDGDGKFSSGDTFAFAFNDCAVRDIVGTLVYNNQMTMTQFSLAGDPQGNPSDGWDMSALFTFNKLSVTEGQATRVYSGDFSFSSSTPDGVRETLGVTGTSLTGAANNAQDVLKDFSLNEKDDRAAFTYSFSANATLDSARYGELSIKSPSCKTGPCFSGTSPFDPSGGTMLITATDKSSVKMIVNSSTSITVEIDANGDGTVDTTRDTAWSVLSGS
ncbi:MAG TPA: hypothetical protein VKA13_03215 [Gammaproteobacteria bacterium]|nr:hypothetical protein [Gammaproteobacteria bacterium]